MATAVGEMKVTAIAPWFGSNRMLASRFAEELDGCKWVGVPFAGGMSELAHIKARTILVNDIHRHVVNLARVIADPEMRPELIRRLDRKAFHPDELKAAQQRCASAEPNGVDLDAATDYFVCVWMGRSHIAGINHEFMGRPSIRWNSNGGDSAVRYRSAVRGLVAWSKIMRRCTFETMDFAQFITRCEDAENHGIYCDPPFPGPGERYKFTLTPERHHELARILSAFKKTRVVCRFYDHPAVREMYPGIHWNWTHLDGGRKQSNDKAPEVMIVNKPA